MSNETETYPVTISQPPAMVNGRRVLAWAELQHTRGMYPGGIVLVVTCPDVQDTEYTTWEAYTRDGGQTWNATTGHYITDHAAAWADFAGRCATAQLTRTF